MTTSNRTLATGARRRARSLGILSGALGLLLLTAPSDGRAEDGDAVRYDRSSGKVKTKNTLNTKFQAAAKQAEKDKGRPPRCSRPTTSLAARRRSSGRSPTSRS